VVSDELCVGLDHVTPEITNG